MFDCSTLFKEEKSSDSVKRLIREGPIILRRQQLALDDVLLQDIKFRELVT